MSSIYRQIPNTLTLLRLMSIPFLAYILWRDPEINVLGASIFVVAAFTDFLDGFLARRLNLTSKFGKIADPLADRLLIATVIIDIALLDHLLPTWSILIVLGRDLLMIAGFLFIRNKMLPDVNWAGKVATACLMLSFVGLLFGASPWPLWVFWTGFVFSLTSGILYLIKYLPILWNNRTEI